MTDLKIIMKVMQDVQYHSEFLVLTSVSHQNLAINLFLKKNTFI